MALRDKLAARVQPYLEPGEQVQQVFMAQTGPHPFTLLLLYVFAFWMRYRIVAVTDRAILVVKASLWRPSFPNELLARVPRQTQIGTKLSGFWGTGQLNGEKLFINKRFHKDVAAADAAAAGSAPAPAAPAPPVAPSAPPPAPPG